MLLELFCVHLPFRAVTKELGMMADRIVALEKERDELHEGARWRGQVRRRHIVYRFLSLIAYHL